MIICYTVHEIRHVTDVIIFHFGLFLPMNCLKNQNLTKMKTTPGDLEISKDMSCGKENS